MPAGTSGAIARIYRWAAHLGFACLAGAALVTVADIALRQVGGAVVGVVDLVQLLVMAGAYFAIPYAFLHDGHVAVDLVSARLGRRLDAACRALGALLATGFMLAIARYGLDAAMEQHAYGDRSHTMGIPILWYWAPLLLGAALSVLAALLIAFRDGRTVLVGPRRAESKCR
jgi:TRAP-type C4-dicarboxylate transport system permease small subunit